MGRALPGGSVRWLFEGWERVKAMDWLRLHVSTLDNPKAQGLPGNVFKAWVNFLLFGADERWSSSLGGRDPVPPARWHAAGRTVARRLDRARIGRPDSRRRVQNARLRSTPVRVRRLYGTGEETPRETPKGSF